MKPIVLQGHSRPIRDIKFNKEGDFVFTGSADRLINVWTSETGERIGTFVQKAAVSNMCVTVDSKYLISGDTTGNIFIWDIYQGQKIKEFEGNPTVSVRNIDLSYGDENVSFVISGRQKDSKSIIQTYKLKDLLTMSDTSKLDKALINNIESNNVKFNMAKWTDINKRLFISKEDGSMDLYDLNEKRFILSKKIHNDTILDFDVSPKHEVLLTSSKDGRAHVLNSENFEIINTFYPEKPSRNLNSCKISPLFSLDDENEAKFHCICAGGQESKDVTTTHASEGGFEILFYNMMYGEEIGCVLGHFGPVNTLAFSGNGKSFASGGEDATIRLHHLNDEYFNLK
jgi:translation initiation factor 3 subunit I